MSREASSGSAAAARSRLSRPDRKPWNPGPLDQRADVRERGHRIRVAQQLDRARRRRREAEQHPDQRGLAGAVGPQHAQHRTDRHLEIDPVDRDRRAEHLAQTPHPRSGHGRRSHGRRGGHRDSVSDSTCSGTAPTATRPSSVMMAVATAVLISRPLPHEPLIGRAEPGELLGPVRVVLGHLLDDHAVPAVADHRRLVALLLLRVAARRVLHRRARGRREREPRRVLRAEREVGEPDLQRG